MFRVFHKVSTHQGSKFRNSFLVYKEGLSDKYKMVNTFCQVNYLNYMHSNILLIGCSAHSYTPEKWLYEVWALLIIVKVNGDCTICILWVLMNTVFNFALLSVWKHTVKSKKVREASQVSKNNVMSPAITAKLIFMEVPKLDEKKRDQNTGLLKHQPSRWQRVWSKRSSPG